MSGDGEIEDHTQTDMYIYKRKLTRLCGGGFFVARRPKIVHVSADLLHTNYCKQPLKRCKTLLSKIFHGKLLEGSNVF